jgi:hypothetical protein
LTRIRRSAFRNDSSLNSPFLPASLEGIDMSALSGRGITTITVEDGNLFFRADSSLLIKVDGVSILRYFGRESSIVIKSDIREFSCSCFCHHLSISSVIFEVEAELFRIGKSACNGCLSLKSICIPSPVTVLGDRCFYDCTSLSEPRFKCGLRLHNINESAVERCTSLRSICIPLAVTVLGRRCFCSCISLSGRKIIIFIYE